MTVRGGTIVGAIGERRNLHRAPGVVDNCVSAARGNEYSHRYRSSECLFLCRLVRPVVPMQGPLPGVLNDEYLVFVPMEVVAAHAASLERHHVYVVERVEEVDSSA